MARPVALIKSDFPTLDEVAETYNISQSRRKKLDAFIVDYLNNQAPPAAETGGETASKGLEKPSSQRAGLRKKKKY